VLWEILSRTEADDEGFVPEYKMPFEEEVGVVPTLGDMRMIVVGRKTRPEFRMELLMTAVLKKNKFKEVTRISRFSSK